jgi:hypothetical protein
VKAIQAHLQARQGSGSKRDATPADVGSVRTLAKVQYRAGGPGTTVIGRVFP